MRIIVGFCENCLMKETNHDLFLLPCLFFVGFLILFFIIFFFSRNLLIGKRMKKRYQVKKYDLPGFSKISNR